MIRSTKLSKWPLVLFLTGNVEKSFFSSKVGFCLYFAGASLLGKKFSLASELGNRYLITTGGHLDRRPLISPPKLLRSKDVHTPFERGDSKDYRYTLVTVCYQPFISISRLKLALQIYKRQYFEFSHNFNFDN